MTVPIDKPSVPPRVERRARPRPLIAHWQRFCGWCGTTNPVATDGRNLTCSRCGH